MIIFILSPLLKVKLVGESGSHDWNSGSSLTRKHPSRPADVRTAQGMSGDGTELGSPGTQPSWLWAEAHSGLN